MQSELAFDAGSAREFPDDGLPEVAVMGRSNVGKSSLINALLGRRKLARTSGRPGKTRRIHFYRVEVGGSAAAPFYVVDLPGYGYAAVSKQERGSWRPLVESYLKGDRASLRGAILLVDARRGPEEEERDLISWLDAERIEVAVALTKADKLGSSDAAKSLRSLDRELHLERRALVSARTGKGLRDVGAWVAEWTGVALRRADGSAL